MKTKKREPEAPIPGGMIDTQVLIYAVAYPRPGDHRAKCEKSVALVRRLDPVRITSITWMEFLRKADPQERKKLEAFRTRLRIISVDGRCAQAAIDIITDRMSKQSLCPECLNAMTWAPCRGCQRHRSATQRLNDALILAAADTMAEVDELYTFDNGMLELGKVLVGCTVKEPPSIHGPLYDPKVNPQIVEKQGTIVRLPPK